MSKPGFEPPTTRLKQTSISSDPTTTTTDNIHINKPDFRELDLGSPVSPLRSTRTSGLTPSSLTTTTTTTTSSSSSSSGSVYPASSKPHSGELSDTSPKPAGGPHRTRKPGHARSDSCGSSGYHHFTNSESVSSPPATGNVLPAGNICPSGRIQKTGMATKSHTRSDVLRSGSGHYGHGNIVRTLNSGGGSGSGSGSGSVGCKGNVMSGGGAEEVKRAANEEYKKGNFGEALSLYDKAIAISPANAAYRSNRAAALTGLGRISEAAKECEEAVRLDPAYLRAHHRLGSLLVRLGQVETARKHLFYDGLHPEATELNKLQAVEKHLIKCSDARKIGEWKLALREVDAAIVAGADHSPLLFTCRAECLVKLQQLDEIDGILSNIPKYNPSPKCCLHSKFFGMLSEAYLFYVRAQIEMAIGRFENAVTFAEKAVKIDPNNFEVANLIKNVRLVARARSRGNDLFKSERFTEACAAYGEGLKLDPSNSVLYCNRAACWFKLGMWDKSVEDCNHALRIQPNYTKALLRRAASNSKLERWVEAVRDYEVLRRELPNDNEVAESLFHAQVALRKSRGEEVYNMKFGGDVEEISGLEQFRAEISSPGVSVVHFKISSNTQCKCMSSFFDVLCNRYPSINFLKVDVELNRDVADAEGVRIVPTVKIYKNGSRVKEIINPTTDVLESSVRHYSF